VLWSQRISGSVHAFQAARQVRVLPNGDAAAVGFIGDLTTDSSLLVAVFDGTTGAERWRWTAQGGQHFGTGATLTVADTELIVTGQIRNDVTCYDILVARLDAATGQLLGRLSLDGTATATKCDCDEADCDPRSRVGIDGDRAADLLVDSHGRVVLAGVLSDRLGGGRVVQRGVVRTFPGVLAIGGK
jgi:hypothetical protein